MSVAPSLSILYKGKILGICDVILFIDESEPDVIRFEIADKLSNFPNDTWVYNFKPISETGGFCIMKYKTISASIVNSETLVADLLILLERAYAEQTVLAYTKEITNGTH